MKKKLLIAAVAVILIILISYIGFWKYYRIENPETTNGNISSKTTMYVNPNLNTVDIGETFSVSVEISNVINLCGYDFKLSYDSTSLNITSLEITTIFGDATQIVKEDVNATLQRVWIAVISMPLTPLNGSYVLVKITFKAISEGDSSLVLYDTKLGDNEAQPISHKTTNGQVTVTSQSTETTLGYVNPPLTDITQTGTTIYVSPAVVNSSVGEYFLIYINVSDVVDLYGWEFKLGWNSSLLEVVSVEEGDFLKSGGDTFFTEKINNTAGYVYLACTLLGNVPGVSGNGGLAIIKFYVKAPGECLLDLYDTKLGDSLAQPILHTANDGYGYFAEASTGGRDQPPMPL